METFWNDTPNQSSSLSSLSFFRVIWAVIVFLFVWTGELIFLFWAINSISVQNDFLVSSSFLALWTIICLFTTFYALKKLKSKNQVSLVKIENSIISFPVDSDIVSLAESQIKNIKIINEPEKSETDSPYLIKITTTGNKVFIAPLFDRKGFSQATSSLQWVKKIIRK